MSFSLTWNYLILCQRFSLQFQGNNAAVSYSLEGEDAASFFVTTVNSLGYIYVNASLDYDVKATYNFTVSISQIRLLKHFPFIWFVFRTFQVRATEIYTTEKFNASSTVIIQVTEVSANENNPKFNQSSYSVNVTENDLPGRIVQVGESFCNVYIFGVLKLSLLNWITCDVLSDSPRKDYYLNNKPPLVFPGRSDWRRWRPLWQCNLLHCWRCLWDVCDW